MVGVDVAVRALVLQADDHGNDLNLPRSRSARKRSGFRLRATLGECGTQDGRGWSWQGRSSGYLGAMTMRLEVGFARPLGRDERTRVLLVVSALAGTRRVQFVRGDQGAVVTAEALTAAALRRALAEEGIAVEAVIAPVEEPTEEGVDPSRQERFRPIGR
jgi:hypothetical protein